MKRILANIIMGVLTFSLAFLAMWVVIMIASLLKEMAAAGML